MAKKISELLTAINPLLDQAKQLATLYQRLLKSIPKGQWQIGNYQNGILTLLTPDANEATQLKFIRHDLMHSLRKNGLPALAAIQIKILPKQIAHHITPPLKKHKSPTKEIVQSRDLNQLLKKIEDHIQN